MAGQWVGTSCAVAHGLGKMSKALIGAFSKPKSASCLLATRGNSVPKAMYPSDSSHSVEYKKGAWAKSLAPTDAWSPHSDMEGEP